MIVVSTESDDVFTALPDGTDAPPSPATVGAARPLTTAPMRASGGARPRSRGGVEPCRWRS